MEEITKLKHNAGPDPDLKSDRCIHSKSERRMAYSTSAVGAKFSEGGPGACTPGKFCFDEYSELHAPAF